MARLWSSGAELQSATSGMEFETVTGAGVSIATAIKRSGAASLKFAPTATTALVRHTFQADTINTTYRRFYLYIDTAPGATIKCWQYVDSGNGVGFSLNLTNGRVLQAVNDSAGTTVLSSSSALTLATWYRVEIKIVDDAAAAAQMEWKIDGTTIGTHTSLTGVNGAGREVYGAITGTSSPVLYFDDIAVNDTSGTAQTAYPGAGSIVHLYPDAAGDNAAWTPLASTNISNVDEFPTPDDATSYNAKTTTGTVIDDFNVQSSATGGIGASDTVTLIQVGIRGGSTAVTAGATINPRIKSAAAGTTTTAAVADAYNVNGWRTNGATPFQYGLTSYLDPTTGVAWTPTGTNSLDNMQIGYTNAASNTTVRRVSLVWALVEYVPSLSGPQTLNATALASTAALGAPTLQPGAVSISPASIASTLAIGSAALAFSINPASIGSTAALGAPTVAPGPVTISPTGKASTLAFGTLTITKVYTISPTGIALTSTLGVPTITKLYTISVTGKASTAALGSPTLSPGAVTISPSSLNSVLSIGTLTLTNIVVLSPSSIASTLAFGQSRAFAAPIFTPLGVIIGTVDQDSTLNDATADASLNSPDNEDTITTVNNDAELEGSDNDATINTPTTEVDL